MATLTVRNIDDEIVRRLRIRAAEHGRSEEAEHREILRLALIGEGRLKWRQAAARLREFRRRTAGRGSPSAAALFGETRAARMERIEALAGPDEGEGRMLTP